jgi:hypothetical protein
VQRLDDWDSRLECRVKDGWRGGCERVVNVHDLRPCLSQCSAHTLLGDARPDSSDSQLEITDRSRCLAQLGVVEDHLLDRDSGVLQQTPLSLNDSVLSARLAVPGVYLKDASQRCASVTTGYHGLPGA